MHTNIKYVTYTDPWEYHAAYLQQNFVDFPQKFLILSLVRRHLFGELRNTQLLMKFSVSQLARSITFPEKAMLYTIRAPWYSHTECAVPRRAFHSIFGSI
jgi:hypothetical protein